MKRSMLWIVALATLTGSALCGQDLSGNWQGTLKTGIDLRLILEIARGEIAKGEVAKGDAGALEGYDVQH
jgi:hypothetical protein